MGEDGKALVDAVDFIYGFITGANVAALAGLVYGRALIRKFYEEAREDHDNEQEKHRPRNLSRFD